MISMHPIKEPIVLESLNAERYGENTKGYVIMEKENYLGHILFTVNGTLTTVQECSVDVNAIVDGGVRACVAYGDGDGATHFDVNKNDVKLEKWLNVFFKGENLPIDNKKLLYTCKK